MSGPICDGGGGWWIKMAGWAKKKEEEMNYIPLLFAHSVILNGIQINRLSYL